jgi:hypothetical protein
MVFRFLGSHNNDQVTANYPSDSSTKKSNAPINTHGRLKPLPHTRSFERKQSTMALPRTSKRTRCLVLWALLFSASFLYNMVYQYVLSSTIHVARPSAGEQITEVADAGAGGVCPLDQKPVWEHLACIHNASFPSLVAGRWVYQPKKTIHESTKSFYSAQHLQCLDTERQGNCYHSSGMRAIRMNTDPGAIQNSDGVLNASDPWIWVSEDPAYKVIEDNIGLIRSVVVNRTLYIVGDSLSRQWMQEMRCEYAHLLGLRKEAIRFFWYTGRGSEEPPLTQLSVWDFLEKATYRDYLIFSFGRHHHPSKPGMQYSWKTRYIRAMNIFLSLSFAPIPSNHVFFRTSSVRPFLAGQGDWDTNTSKSGGLHPNMKAVWSDYGGNYPAQPKQNLIGISMVGSQSDYGILDISPLMLSRADATSDGSHFCLPGPIEIWSRMLYYRILQHMQEGEK